MSATNTNTESITIKLYNYIIKYTKFIKVLLLVYKGLARLVLGNKSPKGRRKG